MGIRLILISCLSVLTISMMAQKKVIHNNVACYLHVVVKGNTLYGLSKEYAAPIQKILDQNPEAKIGLNVGQKVFIPLSSINRREAKKSPDVDGNIISHTVAKKETLYSLSKKYKVNINDILESNPGLEKDGLKRGGVVRIPISAVRVDRTYTRPAARDSLLHHEVLLGETLYSLSKNYQVGIDSIRAVNGGLKEGLRAGMTLRIPKYVSGFTSLYSESKNDSIRRSDPLIRNPRLQMNIGLLLPFSLSLADSMDQMSKRGSKDILKLTDIAFEFYRGVQLGLEDLSAYGLSADVVVMDVTGERRSVDECLVSENLKDLDIIIGPLHKESFEMISSDGRLKNVFRASPLSGSLDVGSSRDGKISKLRPSDAVLIESMVRDIKKEHEGENVVLIAGDIRSWHRNVETAWNKDSPDSSITRFNQFTWDKGDYSELLALMDEESPNVLIFPVEHRPTITDLISKLAMTEFRNLDITLYGLEQWLKYDNLDADVLERVNLHVPASQYIDWNSQEVIDFAKDYKEAFNVIPSASGYGILAYDIVKFYIEGMMMYGPEFLESQDQIQRKGLCSGFDMKRTDHGGWVNQYVYILDYQDYEFKSSR